MDKLMIIFIILIIFGVIVILNNRTNKRQEQFSFAPTELEKNYKYSYKRKNNRRKGSYLNVDDVIDDVVSWDSSDSMVVSKIPLKPYFHELKFHNDYRDIITALNNLVPDKKQKFNIPNIPIKYSEPEIGEVKNLTYDFINVLNVNLNREVPNNRNKNSGWDEAVVDPNVVQSGWDKIQNSLGLATSIYQKPALNCSVKLVQIRYVQKYETEDEIKYVIDFVLQKNNVSDQIVLKASFVQDKRTLNDENNFFVTKNVKMQIIIEDLYIVGYLSNQGLDSRKDYDGDNEKYYDYNIMEKNNLTDPKYIQKVLMDKYRIRTEEMEQRNAMLDEEGQNFHRTLPNVYDFSNIQGTRTIFDDMNTKKEFY
jgi:hypothetical protein